MDASKYVLGCFDALSLEIQNVRLNWVGADIDTHWLERSCQCYVEHPISSYFDPFYKSN